MTAPDYLIAGQSVVVECKSGPSNPQAVIEGDVRDIKDVREEENMEVRSSIVGKIQLLNTKVLSSSTSWTGSGWVTTARLLLSSPADWSAVRVTCTASNSLDTQAAVQDTREVAVHCKES